MEQLKKKSTDAIEHFAINSTKWIGSTKSLLIHTALFLGSFLFYFAGVELNKVLLVMTTLLSFEAIYLSIFIQMSVNRQGRRLGKVARDVDEIQKDVEEIQEDVEEIQEDVEGIEKDVDEIQEDVEEIQEDQEEEETENKKEDVTLNHIQVLLSQLAKDVKELKDKQK